jgi:hypothetical protein
VDLTRKEKNKNAANCLVSVNKILNVKAKIIKVRTLLMKYSPPAKIRTKDENILSGGENSAYGFVCTYN